MSWGWVFTILAVVAVAMLVGFAMWLWRLLTDILAEAAVLGRRGAKIVEMLEQLDLTPLERAEQVRARTGDLHGEVIGARMNRVGAPMNRLDGDDDGADDR